MIYIVPKITNPDLFGEYQEASMQECLDYFSDKTYIQVDSETEFNKRNPKHLPNPYEQKLLCFQVGDKNNQFVIDTSQIDIKFLKSLLEDKKKVKIFMNAFFDLRFIFHYDIFPNNIYDLFLAEMLLTLGKKVQKGYRSLEQMSDRYLGVPVSKDMRGQIHWRGLDSAVIKYAATDVMHMEDIMHKQLIKIREYDMQVALDLENAFVRPLAYTSYKGFKVNSEKWMTHYENNLEKRKELSKQLGKWLIDNEHYEFLDNTLFEGLVPNINWNSPTQVVRLFKKLGIPTEIPDKEKGGMRTSVDGKHLLRYLDDFEILPIYLDYKEVEKELSTYGKNFLHENVNPVTGRIHSEFFQLVDTGRISSSNPNLQNIPSEDHYGNTHPLREAFEADEGKILIVSDYSQQEPLVTAEYCQDPYLLDFVLNGDGDTHSLVATMISKYLLGKKVRVTKANNPIVKRYGKPIRFIAKMINLGLDYGKTAYSIKDDLKISQEEAQTLIDIIKSKTPKKEEYFTRWRNFVKKNGYIIIDPITKRRCWFNKWHEINKPKILGELERFAQNYRIQGTGASMMKLAIILFYDFTLAYNKQYELYIVNMIHDEIVLEVPKYQAELTAKKIVELMINAGKVFCKTVPMKVEPVISPIWTK